MPIVIKELGQKGGPKGQDKVMPLPKKKPRHASPKHRMNTEKTKPLGKKEGGEMPVPKSISKSMKKAYSKNLDSENFLAPKKGTLRNPARNSKALQRKAFNKTLKENPQAVKRLNKMNKYAKGGPVTVKSGDTLSQIAKSKGLTLASLMAANPGIKNANEIRVGQKIKMPTGGAKSRAQGIAKKKGVYGDTSKPVMSALARDTAAKRAAKSEAFKYSGTNLKPAPKAKTVNNPKIARKIATTATRLSNLGQVNKNRRADDAAAKARRPDTNRRPTPVSPNKASSFKGVSSAENKRLDAIRKKAKGRADRRMGGGSMKKVQGYKSGGTVRGAGAATRGTGFNRAG